MKNKILMFFCVLAAIGCTNTEPKQPAEKVTALTGKEYLAQYGKTLSLDESLKIARERNLDLRVKSLEREIASLDKKIAFGNFLPSINVMGGYTQLNDEINLDVDVSELSSSMNGFLGALHLPPLPSTMNSRFVDKSFYTFGVSAQIPVFVPSTWYLYAARQKGEKISELAENFADKMLQLQVMGQYY